MDNYQHNLEQEANFEALIKAKERKRIVKILKNESKCGLDKGHDTKGYCFCEAINLIRGEIND